MTQQISIPENLTKESITLLADHITEKAREGEENPLHSLVKIRFMKNVIEAAEVQVKQMATEEASRLSKSGETVIGTEVTYSEDKEWNDLKNKLKKREDMLKGLTKPMADPDSGEIINPPIVKYSAEIVTIKFK
jgi:ribonuclease BN (tRNA processing enzyme)